MLPSSPPEQACHHAAGSLGNYKSGKPDHCPSQISRTDCGEMAKAPTADAIGAFLD